MMKPESTLYSSLQPTTKVEPQKGGRCDYFLDFYWESGLRFEHVILLCMRFFFREGKKKKLQQ